MKCILTENQYSRLRKKIISESSELENIILYYPRNIDQQTKKYMLDYAKNYNVGYTREFLKSIFKNETDMQIIARENAIYKKVVNCQNEAVKYLSNHFSKIETKKKLKNPESAKKVIDFLKKIPVLIGPSQEEIYGRAVATQGDYYFVFVNVAYFDPEAVCETIRHEIGHLIEAYLEWELGETAMKELKAYHKFSDSETDQIIGNKIEHYTTFQGFRKLLTINPMDNEEKICKKIKEFVDDRSLDKSEISGVTSNNNKIIFYLTDKPIENMKYYTDIEKLSFFFRKVFPGNDSHRILPLFSKFDEKNKTIEIDCKLLGDTNKSTVMADPNVSSDVSVA